MSLRLAPGQPSASGFAKLAKDFEDRDAVLLSGSTDNEFCKPGWRRENKDLSRLNHWQFADTTGVLVDQPGIREKTAGVALRATFIVIEETDTNYVIGWQGRYRIEGDAFIYEDNESRRLGAIRGYPLQRLLRVISEADRQ